VNIITSHIFSIQNIVRKHSKPIEFRRNWIGKRTTFRFSNNKISNIAHVVDSEDLTKNVDKN